MQGSANVSPGERGPLRQLLDKAAANEGCSLKDLTVLSSQVDPFRLDTPANHRDGAWLAAAFRDLGLLEGERTIHLRGAHYAILRCPKPDGTPYVNDDDDWDWLGEALKAARWLGYIQFDRISDKKHGVPIVRIFEREVRGSVYKRGSTYTAQFTIGTYRRGDRRTISKGGFGRKKDAQAWLTEQLARFGKGDKSVIVRPSTQTIADFLDDWLEVQRRTRKPSTVGGYRNIVHSWVVPHIGHVQLCDLDWRVFVKLYDHLRREGGRPTKADRVRAAATGTKPVGSPLGARTLQSVHVLLRSALGHAVERELLQVNPTDRIPKALRPTHKPELAEGKHWEPDQAARFLEATRDDRWHALWALGLDTGARRGELLALRWVDIDWGPRTVHVTKNRVVVNGDVVEGTPKSKRSIRDVNIGTRAIAALRHWQREQLAETGRSEFVFTDELGEPLRPDRVNHLMRQAAKRAGVPDVGPHGMRHTAATLMLDAGLPLHVVSQRLGHADTSVTASLYAHVLKDQQTGAGDTMDRALYGGGS